MIMVSLLAPVVVINNEHRSRFSRASQQFSGSTLSQKHSILQRPIAQYQQCRLFESSPATSWSRLHMSPR